MVKNCHLLTQYEIKPTSTRHSNLIGQLKNKKKRKRPNNSTPFMFCFNKSIGVELDILIFILYSIGLFLYLFCLENGQWAQFINRFFTSIKFSYTDGFKHLSFKEIISCLRRYSLPWADPFLLYKASATNS